jgi:beta-barrel assembly-enhancing protease
LEATVKRLVLIILLGASTATTQFSRSAPPITDTQEIRAGEILAEKYERSVGLAPTPEITRIESYLQQVGNRLAEHAQRKLPYRFHYDPNPAFKSAVGLPGGQIFVGAGILTYMDTEDELAIVLGHEMEHVDLGQCRRRLAQEMAKGNLSFAKLRALPLDPFLGSYGHDGEFAADLEGVKLAMQAGYSADAGVRILRMFVFQADQMPHTPSEVKSNLEARIAQIQPLADARQPAPEEKPLALKP